VKEGEKFDKNNITGMKENFPVYQKLGGILG